jgi:hypothetical protein
MSSDAGRKNFRIDNERGLVILGDLELDIKTIEAMANPDARVLWAFIKNRKTGRVQAVPFDESKVIWLEPSDMPHADEAEYENGS